MTAPNFYDNYIAVILGWDDDAEQAIHDAYSDFEDKYASRKSKGELKSQTLRQDQFANGFASMNKPNTAFVSNFLSLFNADTYLYFAVINKIEYIISQVLDQYRNSLFFDMDAIKYSVTKAISLYRPKEILEHTFCDTAEFVSSLKSFLLSRIEANRANPSLKANETKAFQSILTIISKAHDPKTIEWDYDPAFYGFRKYLQEQSISEYSLVLDKEGEDGIDSRTLIAARHMGFQNAQEVDSKECVGIRFADMFAGLIAKMMKAISNALSYSELDDTLKKKILGPDWFRLTEAQLSLYKKLHYIICELNNAWYKSFAGNYSDDLVSFVALLKYMDQFSSVDDITEIEMQGEYFNSFCCECLAEHYKKMHNKLPVDPIPKDSKEYFLNDRGARVFFDVDKQPILTIPNGQKEYYVLSIGVGKNMCPFLTVSENGAAICYRLPQQLSDWAMTVVGLANAGEQLFPSPVVFSNIGGKYFADIQ